MKKIVNIKGTLTQLAVACLFSAPVFAAANNTTNAININAAKNTALGSSRAESSTAELKGNIKCTIVCSQKASKGIVFVKKADDHDWSYVLQDSTGTIILVRNCINETDTIFDLGEGTYVILELNPYGIGSVKEFTMDYKTYIKFAHISSEKKSIIRLQETDQHLEINEQDPSFSDLPILKIKNQIEEPVLTNNIL